MNSAFSSCISIAKGCTLSYSYNGEIQNLSYPYFSVILETSSHVFPLNLEAQTIMSQLSSASFCKYSGCAELGSPRLKIPIE